MNNLTIGFHGNGEWQRKSYSPFQIIIHEEFDKWILNDDIGLVQLREKIDLSGNNIKKVLLPLTNDLHDKLIFAGRGTTSVINSLFSL